MHRIYQSQRVLLTCTSQYRAIVYIESLVTYIGCRRKITRKIIYTVYVLTMYVCENGTLCIIIT